MLTPARLQRSQELKAMTLLRLGASRGDPPRDTETYNEVAGLLRAVANATGETPEQTCQRLRVTGYRRTRILHGPTGRKRFRFTKKERFDRINHRGPYWRQRMAEARAIAKQYEAPDLAERLRAMDKLRTGARGMAALAEEEKRLRRERRAGTEEHADERRRALLLNR